MTYEQLSSQKLLQLARTFDSYCLVVAMMGELLTLLKKQERERHRNHYFNRLYSEPLALIDNNPDVHSHDEFWDSVQNYEWQRSEGPYALPDSLKEALAALGRDGLPAPNKVAELISPYNHEKGNHFPDEFVLDCVLGVEQVWKIEPENELWWLYVDAVLDHCSHLTHGR